MELNLQDPGSSGHAASLRAVLVAIDVIKPRDRDVGGYTTWLM